MKILITTDLFTVTTNGVVTSVRNLYDELTGHGHDVRILTLSKNRRSRKDGHFYYIRSASLGAVYPDVRMPTSFRHPLIQELIDWKPDVIHSQCEFFTFQYALRISRKTGAPIIHTYHTLYEQYFGYLLPSKRLGRQVVKVLSKKRLKKVKQIIAPTEKVENALRSYGLHNPISVIPSGIDLSQHKVRISATTRRVSRQSLGITDDQLVLLNLGRLGTEKNLDELVRFFAKARETHENLIFLVVGGGPAKESLEELAKELHVEQYVIFTGMVRPEQVQEYYQLGDVFISASTSETQGLTYIEAAANGLPLLCRDDPCLHGVLIPDKNGYAYHDEAEFLAAVDEISKNPGWLKTAGQYSQEIADSFDKQHFGDSVEAVYDDVLAHVN